MTVASASGSCSTKETRRFPALRPVREDTGLPGSSTADEYPTEELDSYSGSLDSCVEAGCLEGPADRDSLSDDSRPWK
jgi:hypothetical protein